jgi:tetratricopeptide (TPR) repeat protein
MMRKHLTAAAVSGVLWMLCASNSWGLLFYPTEEQWTAWPESCKARYVVSAAGQSSEFTRRVPTALISKWEQILRADAWYGFHHYCAGIALMGTASTSFDPVEIRRMYTRAVEEIDYALRSTNPGNPVYAALCIAMAQAHTGLDDHKQAARFFDLARTTHPENAQAHASTAVWLRDQGKVADARKVLQEGIEAQQTPSAELHYLLGLVLIELGEYEAARKNADTAYALGYPLPGLKRKLAGLGNAGK